jgi:GcrA cell cycle regulator
MENQMITTQWTEEKIETLKQLLADGKSAGQISKIIGATRNSIIGKVRRMGEAVGRLNGYQARNPGRYRSLDPNPKRPRLVIYRTYAAFAPESPMSVKYEVPDQAQKAATGEACGILDLTHNTCHWPLWDEPSTENKQYCGAPSQGKVYCQCHTFMAGPLYRRPVVTQPESSPPSESQ